MNIRVFSVAVLAATIASRGSMSVHATPSCSSKYSLVSVVAMSVGRTVPPTCLIKWAHNPRPAPTSRIGPSANAVMRLIACGVGTA